MALAALALCVFLFQPATRPVEVSRTWQYTVTGADGYPYVISVAEPTVAPGQKFPEAGFGVLYVLDANQNFLTAVQTARFQKGVGPVVIVGIGHAGERPDTARRYRDFTPVTPQENIVQNPQAPTRVDAANTGGEEAFFSFLTTQVKPEIERRFKIDPDRQALFGHSLSGRFVLHVLAKHPEAFSIYIAASPSIWWNKGSLLEELTGLKALAKPTAVFIGVGETEQNVPAFEPAERKALLGSLKMVDRAREAGEMIKGLPGATVHFQVFEGENHGSSAPMSMARGVRLTLSDQK